MQLSVDKSNRPRNAQMKRPVIQGEQRLPRGLEYQRVKNGVFEKLFNPLNDLPAVYVTRSQTRSRFIFN